MNRNFDGPILPLSEYALDGVRPAFGAAQSRSRRNFAQGSGDQNLTGARPSHHAGAGVDRDATDSGAFPLDRTNVQPLTQFKAQLADGIAQGQGTA